MCGIVGLLVKTPALRAQLGQLMVPMLAGMTERGPDSAGLAVFGSAVGEDQRKISLYAGFTEAGSDFNWNALLDALNGAIDVNARVEAKGNHAVLTVNGHVTGSAVKLTGSSGLAINGGVNSGSGTATLTTTAGNIDISGPVAGNTWPCIRPAPSAKAAMVSTQER